MNIFAGRYAIFAAFSDKALYKSRKVNIFVVWNMIENFPLLMGFSSAFPAASPPLKIHWGGLQVR